MSVSSSSQSRQPCCWSISILGRSELPCWRVQPVWIAMLGTLVAVLSASAAVAQEGETRAQVIARSGGFPALEPRSSDYNPRPSRLDGDGQGAVYRVQETDPGAQQPAIHGSDETATGVPLPSAPESSRSKMIAPLVTVGSSLAIVLALFCALVWAGRKFGGGVAASKPLPASALTPLGHVMLDPRTKLLLVKCGRRILVLSQTAGGITPITEVTHPDEVRELIANCSSEAREVFQRTLREIELEPVSGFTDEPPRQPAPARPSGRLFATTA